MTPDFARALPGWLREFIDETEASIGFEIQVAVSPLREVMACEVDTGRAVILTPSREAFKAGSVLHELLHIQRILVDGVPRLLLADSYPDSPAALQIESSLVYNDNMLEHLVIVPIELERVPDVERIGRPWYLGTGMRSPMERLLLASRFR